MNIALFLTNIRIFLIPVIVGFFYYPAPWAHLVAALVFALASLTDWLDGYLARHYQLSTSFGAFLDPVADKLVVVFTLVLLVSEMPQWWIVLPAAIIISREIAVSALREWMAEIGQHKKMVVTQLAKIKTTIQMIALTALLSYHSPMMPRFVYWVGLAGLYASVLLTLWSMMIYLRLALPDLTLSLKRQ